MNDQIRKLERLQEASVQLSELQRGMEMLAEQRDTAIDEVIRLRNAISAARGFVMGPAARILDEALRRALVLILVLTGVLGFGFSDDAVMWDIDLGDGDGFADRRLSHLAMPPPGAGSRVSGRLHLAWYCRWFCELATFSGFQT